MWFSMLLGLSLCAQPSEVAQIEVTPEHSYRIGELPLSLNVRALGSEGELLPRFCGPVKIEGQEQHSVELLGGVATITDDAPGNILKVWTPQLGEKSADLKLRSLPGWVSILPPLISILLAVLLREALLALFGGILVGALLIHGFNPLTAFLRTLDTHLLGQVADKGHAAIIMFTLALGGMSAVLSRSGGTKALVGWLSKRAKTRRAGMLSAWGAGLAVFFDDYANCMLVGSTLRPFTDKLKISREKLAYLVDSTAAPIATVALISTWVGYQLSLFEKHIPDRAPYDLFLDILPYSFYSLLTIAFVFMLAVTGRDFGPMAKAELRAASGKGLSRSGAQPLANSELMDLEPPAGTVPRSSNAIFPLLTIVATVAIGMYASGLATSPPGASLRSIVANADPNAVLLWAAFGGSLVAVLWARATQSLKISEALEAWLMGLRAMTMAILILILAWTIGSICQDYLSTGPWIMSQFAPSPRFLPVITFFVCALVAFATGSSFSTMAIVAPIAAPLAWAILPGSELPLAHVEGIRHATLAALLSGAVFGDHCSPISDTTVMSSMASAADHIDHVKTQAPYALSCAGVAAGVGFIPAGYGLSPWVSVGLGVSILFVLLRILGRRVPAGL